MKPRCRPCPLHSVSKCIRKHTPTYMTQPNGIGSISYKKSQVLGLILWFWVKSGFFWCSNRRMLIGSPGSGPHCCPADLWPYALDMRWKKGAELSTHQHLEERRIRRQGEACQTEINSANLHRNLSKCITPLLRPHPAWWVALLHVWEELLPKVKEFKCTGVLFLRWKCNSRLTDGSV